MQERNAGKEHAIMLVLNSMTAGERKYVLNRIYGIYVGSKDSSKVEICIAILNSMTIAERKEFLNRIYGLNDSLKEVKKDIKVNINDIGTITEVVRLMLVSLLSNEDMKFKRRILEDAYNKLEDNASLFAFPPFD